MKKQVLCENCNSKRDYHTKSNYMDYEVKNEVFTIFGTTAYCNECGNELFQLDTERANQNIAFDQYRRKHNLISVEDIVAIRNQYKLNQKDFSLLLGFGEIQITRYERGSIPTSAHSLIIKQAKNPSFMQQCFIENGHKFDPTTRQRISTVIKARNEAEREIIEPIREMMTANPNEENGYRSFNWRKIKSLITFFSKEQVPHFTTMCKLLFYSDFYHYLKYNTSISGSRYIRMPYGPCPERYETIFESIPSIAIEPSPRAENGRILRSIGNEHFDFSEQEWETIRFVNEKFTSIRSRDISEFSHEERAWLENKDNEIISYEYAKFLNPERQVEYNKEYNK